MGPCHINLMLSGCNWIIYTAQRGAGSPVTPAPFRHPASAPRTSHVRMPLLAPASALPSPAVTLWADGGVDLSTVRGPGPPAPLLGGPVASQCRAMVGESAPGVVREMWIPS
ncbi:unnamed protein product [Boreogadus saida]